MLSSDLGLTDRSGLELMGEFKRTYQIARIAISGFGMDSDIARSKAAGFDAHLATPVAFGKLDASIQRVARER